MYIPQQQAYFDFCKFITETAKIIYGENAKPYELELLLFTLADKGIYEDIRKNLKLSFR